MRSFFSVHEYRHFFLRFAVFLVAGMCALAAYAQPRPDALQPRYRLGIIPYITPRGILDQFGPVSTGMSAALNVPVKLETAPDYSSFEEALAAEIYDIALIQPFEFYDVVEKRGYLPLARVSIPAMAQFFVRSDSKYKKIEDLRGTKLALPPALSASARMALHVLFANNLVPGRDLAVHNYHANDSCLQQVWTNAASACVTAQPAIVNFERRMQASFRSIHDSQPIPNALFVVHPRVPAVQRKKLEALLTGWSENAAGRALLKRLGIPGLVPVRPGEYLVLRKYQNPPGSGATR
jgi:ABC-type phosphate/phosphonate transport system substrate-binding protein